MLLDCCLRNNMENAPTKALTFFYGQKNFQTVFTIPKIKNSMENGRLNADISTKMGTKTTKIPIIVFQIHYKLKTVENGAGGGSDEKYPKI